LQKFKPIEYAFKAFTLLGHYKKAQQQLKKYRPQVVITTNWAFNLALRFLKSRYQHQFINIITDPRTYFPLNISAHADWTCCFDQHQAEQIKKTHPKLKIKPIGWLVKSEFERTYNREDVRKEMKMANVLTLLFVSGWEGTETIFSFLPKLENINNNLQIIVACGTNRHLFHKINNLRQHLKNKKITLIPLPFTRELYKYMQAADLVIGKAGPNSLFEATATLTPFFATTHIAGQEDGNLEIIKEYNLGYVEEKQDEAFAKLVDIINHPEQLKQFAQSIKKMADYNRQARDKFLAVVEKALAVEKTNKTNQTN
jgi:processive 1,2-diacylglycerol beta-glucosyltransferase